MEDRMRDPLCTVTECMGTHSTMGCTLVYYSGAVVHPICLVMFGLSKERPILDHHAKAHILDFMKSSGFQVKIRQISWNLADFREIRQISGENLVDFTPEICQISQVKIRQISRVEIRRISKDQLPGMVSPMFFSFLTCINNKAI